MGFSSCCSGREETGAWVTHTTCHVTWGDTGCTCLGSSAAHQVSWREQICLSSLRHVRTFREAPGPAAPSDRGQHEATGPSDFSSHLLPRDSWVATLDSRGGTAPPCSPPVFTATRLQRPAPGLGLSRAQPGCLLSRVHRPSACPQKPPLVAGIHLPSLPPFSASCWCGSGISCSLACPHQALVDAAEARSGVGRESGSQESPRL